jgi:flavin-binding protein dodecin
MGGARAALTGKAPPRRGRFAGTERFLSWTRWRHCIDGVRSMSIVRSIEVIAQSNKGFDDACRQAVKEAAQTLRGIHSFWIKNAECIVENDRITMYRVNGKISFLLEEDR